MNPRLRLAAALLVLTACKGEEQKQFEAESAKYETLRAGKAEAVELCRQAGAVKDAAAGAGDVAAVERWGQLATADCAVAKHIELLPSLADPTVTPALCETATAAAAAYKKVGDERAGNWAETQASFCESP